jgi:L-2,4-diaminobutyric acid acetyltransferase
MISQDRPSTHPSLRFRAARPSDGTALWQLVQATGTLEANSAYCYLLFATDFRDTCLVAEQDGQLVGAVIGYHPPREADTAFVWQVGVQPDHQGQASRPPSPNNPASQALFRRLARDESDGSGHPAEAIAAAFLSRSSAPPPKGHG